MKTLIANLESLSAILDSISYLEELEPCETEYVSHLISSLRDDQQRLLAKYYEAHGCDDDVVSLHFESAASFDDQTEIETTEYGDPESQCYSADEYLERALEAISAAHFDEAECILTEALRYHPNQVDLITHLALTYWELGEMDKCAEFYQEAMALSCPHGYSYFEWAIYPEHTFLRSMEGRALALCKIGERKEATELFETLYDYNRDRYAGCIYLAGENYHLRGELQKALDAYNLSPEEPCVFYNKALVCHQLGKREEAIENLIYAFALNPHIATKLLSIESHRDGIIPGYLGSAAYADDFLDACAPLWRVAEHLNFLERAFHHPLVQSNISSFDQNGDYIQNGTHHRASSITKLQTFRADVKGIIKTLLHANA